MMHFVPEMGMLSLVPEEDKISRQTVLRFSRVLSSFFVHLFTIVRWLAGTTALKLENRLLIILETIILLVRRMSKNSLIT